MNYKVRKQEYEKQMMFLMKVFFVVVVIYGTLILLAGVEL